MRYGDAAAFRMALEQRLRDRAADGASLARDRKRVAFDRLLARLVVVAEGRWVLKGGFALDLRFDARARSTKDVDIEWRAPEGEMTDALLDAAAEETGDFFAFTIRFSLTSCSGSPGSIASRSRPCRWSSSWPKSSTRTPGSTRVDVRAPGSRTWSISS
jgi:Nucleotidyl transferase AbiEii toxin, Type IV TA system